MGLIVGAGQFSLTGVEPTSRVQLLMFCALVASLLTVVVWGAPGVDAANVSPPLSTGLTGMLTGAAVLYFVCLCANFIIDRDPDAVLAAAGVAPVWTFHPRTRCRLHDRQ